MDEVSNRTIVALLAVALVVSVAGTLYSVSELSDLGGTYKMISSDQGVTGAFTQSGTSSVTLEGILSIKLVNGTINWGSGYVDPGFDFTYLDSNTSLSNVAGGSAVTEWINTTPYLFDDTNLSSFHLVNNGSVYAYVNISSETTASAEAWLCSGSSCTSTSAKLEVKVAEEENDACTSNGAMNSTYAGSSGRELLTETGKNSKNLCKEWNYEVDNDELYVTLNATIPADAATQTASLTLTFTALDASLIG